MYSLVTHSFLQAIIVPMLPVIVVAFDEFWVAWPAAERKQHLDCEQAHEGDGYDGDESNGAQNAD